MSESPQSSSGTSPIIWIAAGAGVALLIIIIAAIALLPIFRDRIAVAPDPTATWTIAPVPTDTVIPTFTSSPTVTPSETPPPTATSTPSATPPSEPTETPSPTPTITPTPLPMVRAVTDSRLYEGPGTGYAETGWLVQGRVAVILAQLSEGGWWYVETERGIRGWIRDSAVTLENDVSMVPVVTPLPRATAASTRVPATPVPTPTSAVPPAPVLGPLLLTEVWPNNSRCAGNFEFDLWMLAKGGTGIFTYLVNGQVVAENVVNAGASYHVVAPISTWLGTVTVISGEQRVDRQVGYDPNQYCQ